METQTTKVVLNQLIHSFCLKTASEFIFVTFAGGVCLHAFMFVDNAGAKDAIDVSRLILHRSCHDISL